MTLEISPALLLRAYAAGVFPMAESADDLEVFWVDPELRGVLPLDGFHLSKRLARTIRSGRFEVHCDTDFTAIIQGCAESTEHRQKTWINREIVALYTSLNRQGFAHSVECWYDGRVVGGLYGVALGGAFFGESMFSRERDASKVALAHLVAILRQGAFTLLDVQFVTPHLERFGAIEIPRAEYHRRLDEALRHKAHFAGGLGGAAVVSVLQSRTLTS